MNNKRVREEIDNILGEDAYNFGAFQSDDNKMRFGHTAEELVKIRDSIMAIFAREQDLHEIQIRKGILRRISLNESNDYPLVDESKSLADVKEAQINRIKQLTKQIKEEK